MNKVVIAFSDKHLQRITSYFNPLEFENHSYDASQYGTIPEQGINPYTSPFFRVPEYFGNYLYALSSLVHCPVPYDRTDEFNMLNFHIDPIPEVTGDWNRTLEEVFLERAEEIWNLNKLVRVWYSGGIDSTAVLIALLRAKKPAHKLIVYMSDLSVKENPLFYETLKKMNDISFQWNDRSNIYSFDNWCDGSINVTGETGDPLYGSFVVEHHIEDVDSPWRDMIEWKDARYIFKDHDYRHDYHRPRFMEFAENFIKKCPFEVRTTFDFSWWLAFSIKWQWINARIYAQCDNPSNWQNMISFYSCPEIQKWSIVNHDLKHKGTWKTYKWPSKEFIYNYNKDSEYRDNKVKVKSLPNVGSSQTAQNILLMTSGEYFQKTEDEKYGIVGLDPEITFLNKWEIFNELLWKKWQKIK